MFFMRCQKLTSFSPEDLAGEVSESDSSNNFLVLMRPPGW